MQQDNKSKKIDKGLEIISEIAASCNQVSTEQKQSGHTIPTEQAVALIKRIGESEKQIRDLRKMLDKMWQQVDSSTEAELRRREVKQDQLIARLEGLLDLSIEADLVLQAFEKVFKYDWEDDQTLQFTKKLRNSANKIIRLSLGYESVATLELATTLGSVYQNLGENDKARYILDERSLPLIKRLEQQGHISTLQATEAYYRLYDYICGLDIKYLASLQSWAENHPLENERTYWMATAHTCSACTYLKINQLSLAHSHFQIASENLEELYKQNKKNDSNLSSAQRIDSRLNTRIAYFLLMQGIYHYKKGELYYEEAELRLNRFFEYAQNTGLSSYASGYVSYLLSKIYKAKGNNGLAIIHQQKAKLALANI
ncbi:MAG: hypothetical protein GFH27_549293n318 [Chloroflexi bacterium AL-W]|nr:hypothetical protein [Chloroflexi bacterium AL-N1]NOK67567.1 hypothetical protein [Chloroflexi bacterium AL-N10]NOK75663.1 hypothetical protein [Chloroflexi bacterium AL-N5]NOK82451.1 hypothetical protein [Chloroflexi bacterium AL-W]NOK90296.1 hypothetical protein [Chloroflexi bacterium AL-N15]